jgi:hypothetical protein
VPSRAIFFAAELTRQQAVIFQVDKPIPFSDMLTGQPLMAHSDFFEDALRSGISRKVGCVNPVQPKGLEPKRHHGPCRFRRESLAPVGDTNPIAEFSALLPRC